MKRVWWALYSAVVLLSCVAANVRAQSDDLFGTPPDAQELKPTANANPAVPAAEDDIFGPAISQPRNQNPAEPTPVPAPDPISPPRPAPTTTPARANPLQPGAVQPVSEVPRDNFCKCEGDANLAASAKIEQALNTQLRSTGLEFADTPLEEVMHLLQDEYDIPIQIDVAALEEHGIGRDEPVTINLKSISLGSALRLMLKPLQLTSMIEDEVLLITTPAEAESRIKICVYDVRDLIDANPSASLKQLTDVVTSCVSSESWEGSRGKGSIRSYPPNLLVISQPQPVHVQIQDLLKRMRQMRQAPRQEPTRAIPTPTK
jgi:hypothetical protein